MEYVIVGDGAAGTTAAQYLRQGSPEARIAVISEDPNPSYFRAALTNYLLGELREHQLFAVPPDFYERTRIARVFDTVTAVDIPNRRVETAKGGPAIPYDSLLIAAGAKPRKGVFPGADLPGVMTMRTLRDARVLLDTVSPLRSPRAVVVGGGPLGLELAQALHARGVSVTYLVRGRRLMDGVLDSVASDLVLSRLRAWGVRVIQDAEIEEVLRSKDGGARAVRLKGATGEIPCQIICVAIGVAGNVSFLEGTGVASPTGVPVDASLRASVDGVYAAGDIAEVLAPGSPRVRSNRLWEPARLQGRVAGLNMAGMGITYEPGPFYQATRLVDLDLAATGRTIDEPGEQVLVDFPKHAPLSYRKVVTRNGRLVGALLLGERRAAVRRRTRSFRDLITSGIDVSELGARILDAEFDLQSWMDVRVPDSEVSGDFAPSRALSRSGLLSRPATRGGGAPMSRADLLHPSPSVRDGLQGVGGYSESGIGSRLRPALPVAHLELGTRRFELVDVSTVGRNETCQVVVSDPTVSQLHAEVVRFGGVFYVRDLGSLNGTYVQDALVTVPRKLSDGERLGVGDTVFRFRLQLTPFPAGHRQAPQQAPSEATAADALLILKDGSERERRFPLTAPRVTIGRNTRSDIILAHPSVSRDHARVEPREVRWWIQDVGSTNGTKVNGMRLRPRHGYLLRNGDRIQVGDVMLEFVDKAVRDA